LEKPRQKKKTPRLRFCRKPKILNPKSQRSHSLSPEDPPRDQSIYQFFCPQKSNQRRRRKPTSKGILQNMNEYTEDLINDHHINTHTHKQKKKFLSHPQKAPSIRLLPKAQSPRTKQKAARKKTEYKPSF
jgi:hypothetical protein